MGDVGYYSTVAVGKYTIKPSKVEILNAKRNTINVRSYRYTGAYSNKDITERPYSYIFNVYDEDYKLFYSTGEQLHNNENDTDAAVAYDSFDLLMDLPIDKIYYLQYIVKTVNNLTASSGYYRIS